MNIAVINLGLKNARCMVFSDSGEKISTASQSVSSYVWGDCVEQDANEWWRKILIVMEEAFSRVTPDRNIAAITVTTSASCLVCIDNERKPLRRVIMVSDRRALQQCKTLENTISFSKIKHDSGIGATPDLYIPKMLWLQECEPEMYRRTWKFLSPADYIFCKLGGEIVTDTNSALKFHYNPANESYSKELFDDLDLDLEKLPTVKPPGSLCGELSTELKSRFNITGKTNLMLSSYDAICGVLGSGVFKAGQVCDVSGTVTSVRGITQRHINDPLNRLFISPWLDRNRKMWLAGGSNNMGGGLIEWGKQLLIPEFGSEAYDVMEREASSVPPCAKGLLFLPYILGERAPLWNPNARGVFFGFERKHTRREMFRALFESSAFTTRSLVETMVALGMNVNELCFSGGLAQIDLISQIKADVLGVVVKVPKNFESASIGAAILTFCGLDSYADLSEGVKAMVSFSKTFEPDLQKHIIYSKWFELFKTLYSNLKGLFVDRSNILSDNVYRTLSPDTEEKKENL